MVMYLKYGTYREINKVGSEKMTSKLTNPRTKICAMCRHWNGPVGGLQVKPKVNSPSFFMFKPNEKQTCYKHHYERAAWTSCSSWEQRY